jgi:predicted nucleic acid-binding protein
VTYLDTNILTYALLPNPRYMASHELANVVFKKVLNNNSMIASDTLILEFCHSSHWCKPLDTKIDKLLSQIIQFRKDNNPVIIDRAVQLMQKINYWRNSNDCFHLAFAEFYQCDALMTFDKDFAQLVPYSKIPIKILQV